MKQNHKLNFLITILFIFIIFSSACSSISSLKVSSKQTVQEKETSAPPPSPLPKRKLAYHEARRFCAEGKKRKSESIKSCIKRLIKESTAI